MVDDIEAILEVGSAAAVEIAASALAERGTKTGICANCGKPLLGAYCAVCGQATHTHRRSVRALLHDFIVDIFNFDSRILRTVRALLFQPGELPAAFRKGRTQPYVPSIRLYLFVTLIFFVLLSVTGIALLQIEVTATPVKVVWDGHGNAFVPNPAYGNEVANDPDVKKYIKPLIPISKEKAQRPGGVFDYSTQVHFFSKIGAYHPSMPEAARRQLIESPPGKIEIPNKAASNWMQRNVYSSINRIAADPAALNAPLTTWLPRALFLLLPLYALLLALFHIRRRKDFYLVDHLVFSLSIHTFAFVMLIVAAGFAQLFPGAVVAWLLFAAISVYIFVAMKRFYEQGWIMTTIKFLLVSGIYTLFFLMPAMAVALALSFFGGDIG
jgi:hypothetical protein